MIQKLKIFLLFLVGMSAVLLMAAEDSNTTKAFIIHDTNLTNLIINDGSKVINNQHTEKP